MNEGIYVSVSYLSDEISNNISDCLFMKNHPYLIASAFRQTRD